MPPDDEVDDRVADSGRNVEQKRRDNHGGGGDPLGPREVVAGPSAFADQNKRLKSKKN